MIHTIRTVAVGDQESKIDSPIILYRGDREVEVEFTINGSKFTFTNGGNVIKSTNATHGQLVINTPTGENMFSEVTECHDGKVVFVITKEMIDELIEVGFYSFQIRLFDESQVSRVTIPPVLKGIDIRNPIAAEDETNVVDIGLVDYAVVVKDEFEDLSTFLPDGNYNKTEWESKDVISGAKLNKIEDALYNINYNMETSDLALLNRIENINQNVYNEIDKLSDELESEVKEFERGLNNNIEKFKMDIAAEHDVIRDDILLLSHKTEYITPEMFGATGDGITNDYGALQNALDYCRENDKTLMLFDKLYYTSSTLNIGGVKIRSFSNIPGFCDVMFLEKKDKTYMKNSPNWNYFFNNDVDTTWRDVIDSCAYGCCIISDKNIDILKAYNGAKIDIGGVAVIGNHRATEQNGISDDIPTSYEGNQHIINDVNIIGCGKNGINLYRGFECSSMSNVQSSMNNGHGLFTGQYDGIDSATEYLSFYNCKFQHNRLDGVHFSYWRKHISFDFCYFNNNGQYNTSTLIDPLLGYDRTIPSDTYSMHSGIYFANGNVETDGSCCGLSIKNCLGEDVAKGIHIENTQTSTGAINFITIENNTFYRGHVSADAGVCIYINVKYLRDATIRGIFGQSLTALIFGRDYNDGGQNLILSDYSKDIYYLNSLTVDKDIKSKNGHLYHRSSRTYNKQGGTDLTIEFDDIANDILINPGNLTSIPTAIYILTSTWQANNSSKFGNYLLFVTRLPNRTFIMSTIASSRVDGFASEPRLTEDGILQVDTERYYLYRLSRLDLEDLRSFW